MGLFYHYTDFTEFMSEEQARLVVKRLNQILVEQGKGRTLFGILTEDGTCCDFSTEKKPSDTHVAFMVGVDPMGSELPLDTPIRVEMPTEEDYARAALEENRYLKKKLSQYEGGAL